MINALSSAQNKIFVMRDCDAQYGVRIRKVDTVPPQYFGSHLKSKTVLSQSESRIRAPGGVKTPESFCQ